MKKLYMLGLWCIAALLFTQNSFAQFTIPPKPDVQTSVYDYANLLSASDKAALEQKLINYADSTSTQIVLVIVPTIKGENIGLLAPKWGQEWGVGGSEKQDNGVFILLAQQERKIQIAPGYGVEDRLTAGELGEMTREVIIPEFKAGDYYSGLDKGTDAIIKMLNGKYKSTRKASKSDGGGGISIFIIIFVIIIISILRRRGGRGGGSGGGGFLTGVLLGSLGRSSGSGWSSGGSSGGWSSGGGGGFGGGFGGGGFSGGGSGGSW